MIRLLAVIALAGFGPSSPIRASKHPASDVYSAQKRIIREMNDLYPTVEVTVMWAPCGMVNAAYFPDYHAIVLCTELEQYPDAALGVAAHEMGHAITHQLTDTTDEQDADEVAALSMVHLGYQRELLALGLFFAGMPSEHQAGDPHPGPGFRAWELMCIEAGSEGQPPECVLLFNGLKVRWEHRLHR